MDDLFIVGFRNTDGTCSMIGYTKNKLSVKQLRRLATPYRKNKEFLEEIQVGWYRLYDTKEAVRRELMEIF